MCTLRPRALAISATARISASDIDRAEIARLGQVDRRGLAAVKLARRDPGQDFGEALGADPAVFAGDRGELEAAAEKACGIGLGCVDVRRFAAIDDAP